jgi:hypothetical protein
MSSLQKFLLSGGEVVIKAGSSYLKSSCGFKVGMPTVYFLSSHCRETMDYYCEELLLSLNKSKEQLLAEDAVKAAQEALDKAKLMLETLKKGV